MSMGMPASSRQCASAALGGARVGPLEGHADRVRPAAAGMYLRLVPDECAIGGVGASMRSSFSRTRRGGPSTAGSARYSMFCTEVSLAL